MKIGRVRGAFNSFQKAIEIDNNFKEAYKHLQWALT